MNEENQLLTQLDLKDQYIEEATTGKIRRAKVMRRIGKVGIVLLVLLILLGASRSWITRKWNEMIIAWSQTDTPIYTMEAPSEE